MSAETPGTPTTPVPTVLQRGDLPARRVVPEDELRRITRRSLITGGLAVAAGATAFRKIVGGAEVGRAPKVLRAAYELNEDIWSALTDIDRLAPEFDFAESAMPIVNGRKGIEDDVDVERWRLAVRDPDGTTLAYLSLDDIRAMPFTESIFEFTCIEGWSEVTAFGGVRVRDLIDAVAPGMAVHAYVGMNTPNGEYPVALDMQTMMHPQTLLAYEMQRAPLTQGHGAPIRLCTPLKYGIKNIRRPGTMRFSDEPPPDYWGERGYSDWVGL